MLLTKDEWWNVMRQAKPGITRAQFDAAWVEFVAEKMRRRQIKFGDVSLPIPSREAYE